MIKSIDQNIALYANIRPYPCSSDTILSKLQDYAMDIILTEQGCEILLDPAVRSRDIQSQINQVDHLEYLIAASLQEAVILDASNDVQTLATWVKHQNTFEHVMVLYDHYYDQLFNVLNLYFKNWPRHEELYVESVMPLKDGTKLFYVTNRE